MSCSKLLLIKTTRRFRAGTRGPFGEVATYTANLASILTASRAVYGVENMVELVGADHICVLEPSVHQDPSVKKYWPTHPNQTVVVSPRHGDPSKDACPTCTTARLR